MGGETNGSRWGTMAMDGKHYSQGIHPKTHPLAILKTKKKSHWEEEEKHFFSFILDKEIAANNKRNQLKGKGIKVYSSK